MEGVPDARNLKCPARYDLLEKPDRSAAFRLGLAFVAQQGGKRLRFVGNPGFPPLPGHREIAVDQRGKRGYPSRSVEIEEAAEGRIGLYKGYVV